MKILAIGDIVGSVGCEYLKEQLTKIKTEYAIDLVIANGENSSDGNGILPYSANYLFKNGVDVITTGNHAFKRRESYALFNKEPNLIRPANYPSIKTPGKGFCEVNVLNNKVIIINLLGTTFMDNLDCPFRKIDYILKKLDDNAIIIVDFHAEATSEKKTLGFYLDGRVSAIFGTHTHVQTADEYILPNGTGYITDVGMTGVIHSALGVKPELVLKRLKTRMPVRFENATGKCRMNCVVFDIDEESKKTKNIIRLAI